MINLDWKRLWNESQRDSLMENRRPEGDKWLSFWDNEATAYLERVKRDEALYKDIVDFLRREQIFRDRDNVLDIASGPGTYTLQFAPAAKSVTALDISAGMLATLMREAEARGLSNIVTVRSTWDEYATTGRYDLVFTALSPAIKGPDEFLRMESLSSRSCCYVTFGVEEQSKTRDDLWKILAGKEHGKKDFNISYPFNLLMSMGRKPNVRFFDYVTQERMTVDQLADYHAKFFGNFMEMDTDKRARIREYLQAMATGECCESWSKKSLAALFWDVPGK